MADNKKKGGQESKKGKPRSAGKAKAKIAGYYASGRVAQKKLRRVLRSNGIEAARAFAKEAGLTPFLQTIAPPERIERIKTAEQRRARVREERATRKLAEARARHEAKRVAEAAAKAAAEKKALLSARAKKGAATKAAKKAAKLASEQASAIPAELTELGIQ